MPPEIQAQIDEVRQALAARIADINSQDIPQENKNFLIRAATTQAESDIADLQDQAGEATTSSITAEAQGAPVEGQQIAAPQMERPAAEPPAAPPAEEEGPKTSPAEEYNRQYIGHNRNPFSVPRPEVPPGYMPDPRRTGHVIPINTAPGATATRRIAAERAQGRTPLTEKERFTEARLRPTSDDEYFQERDRLIGEDLTMIRQQQQALVDEGVIDQATADRTVADARIDLEASFDRSTEQRRRQEGLDTPVPEGGPVPPTAPEGEAAPEAAAGEAAPGAPAARPRAPGARGAAGAPTGAGAPGAAPPAVSERPRTREEIQREILTRMEQSFGREGLNRFLADQEQNELLAEQARRLRDMKAEEAANRLRENQEFKNQLMDQQRRLADLRRQTLDPNRLFSDRGLGTSMALGVAAGALQQTMLGILYPGAQTANTALQLINSAIERDINGQIANLRRGDDIFEMENGLLAQARQLTDSDRDARAYAIGAAQEYMAGQLEVLARQANSEAAREQMLRTAMELRRTGENQIAEFERQAMLDNARIAAARRGRGGAGGGGRGPAALTGERADIAAYVQSARNNRPLPGTTDLYFTPDAILQTDRNGNVTQVRDVNQIFGPDGAKVIERYQRGATILRELPRLEQLAEEDGAFTPLREANARLRSAMNLLVPELAKIVAGGFAPSESDMAQAREILGDPGIFTSMAAFRASIAEARRRIGREMDSIVDLSNGNLRRGAPRSATVRRAQERPEERSYSQMREEVTTIENEQERAEMEAARERARRQQAQRSGGEQ